MIRITPIQMEPYDGFEEVVDIDDDLLHQPTSSS